MRQKTNQLVSLPAKKMFTASDDIIFSLYPLLLLLKTTGFVLFSTDHVRNTYRNTYFSILNLTIYVIHVVYVWYAAINTFGKYITAPDTLQKVYAVVFLVNAFSLIGVNIIWDKYHNNKFLNLLRQFYKVDKDLRGNNIFLDYKKLRNRATVIILAEFSVYTYFNIDTATIFCKLGFQPTTVALDFLFYQGLHMMQVTMTGKCVTLFAITENIFHRLNVKMQTDETSVQLVQKIRRFYHDAYELVSEANEVIAFQLVVPLCVTFVMVVYHIYYQIMNSALQESVTVLVWLSAILIKTVVVITQIHGVTTAVNLLFLFRNQ